METPRSLPDGISLDRPSAARMYDFYLGGHHNFEIDRQAATQAIAMWPDLPLIMQANRAFLRRAVSYLAGQGMTQFLDIGSGIPTVGNVHEVAQRVDPAARVVYVDIDPVAVAHSAAILGDNPGAVVIQGDVCQPERVLAHPQVQRLLDRQQPLVVLLMALLHFVADDAAAYHSVQVLREALVPGSYLVLSHASFEGMPDESREHERFYARMPTPMRMRSHADIARFFDGLELLPPGLVFLPLWRPDGPDDLFLEQPERCTGYAGVGRKP